MTTRKRWSAKDRMKVLQAHEEKCCLCGGVIERKSGFELHHNIALAIGGSDSLDNLAPAHKLCHRNLTSQDAPLYAKTRRQEQKSWGVKTSKGRGFPKREKIRPSVTKVIPIRPLYRRDA